MEQGSIIDPVELSVGDRVQYEEKHFAASIIEIIEDLSNDNFVRYKAEVLEPIFGFQRKGSTFEFGHSLREEDQNIVSAYLDWKVKEVGSLTDYIKFSTDYTPEEYNKFVSSLAKKYDD